MPHETGTFPFEKRFESARAFAVFTLAGQQSGQQNRKKNIFSSTKKAPLIKVLFAFSIPQMSCNQGGSEAMNAWISFLF
jgi:hypothetical protein